LFNLVYEYVTDEELELIKNTNNLYIDIENLELSDKSNYNISLNPLIESILNNKKFDFDKTLNNISQMIFGDIIGDFDYAGNYIEMYDYLNDNIFKTEVIAVTLLFFKYYFNNDNDIEKYNLEQLVKEIDNNSVEYPDIIKNINKLKKVCKKCKSNPLFNIKKEDKNKRYKITTRYKRLFYGILKNINIAPVNINSKKTIYSYAKNKYFINNLYNLFLEKEYLESIYILEKLFSVRTSLYSYVLLLKESNNRNIKHIMKLLSTKDVKSQKSKYEKNILLEVFTKIKHSNIVVNREIIIAFIIAICKEEYLGDELKELLLELADNIEQCLDCIIKIFIILLFKIFQYDTDSILSEIYNSDLYKKIIKTEKRKNIDTEFKLSRKEREDYKYIAKLLINILDLFENLAKIV